MEYFELIKESKLFDEEFYKNRYSDIDFSIESPLEHFCRVGLKEGREPNPHFKPDIYAKKHNIDKDTIYPFIHYITYSKRAIDIEAVLNISYFNKIPPINGFDTKSYLKVNQDIDEQRVTEHLYSEGLRDIRDGKRYFHKDFECFNEAIYLQRFKDIANALKEGKLKSAFEHFCYSGYKEILNKKRVWDRQKESLLIFLGFDNSGIKDIEINNSKLIQLQDTQSIQNGGIYSVESNSVEYFNKSFSILQRLKERYNIYIVWITRDIIDTYITSYHQNSTIENFVDNFFEVYRVVLENIVDYNNLVVSYSNLLNQTDKTVDKIAEDTKYFFLKNSFYIKSGFKYTIKNRVNIDTLSDTQKDFVKFFNNLTNLEKIIPVNKYIHSLYIKYFDEDYYLGRYRDVYNANFNPKKHYRRYGWIEDRDPHIDFDNRFYKENIYKGKKSFTPFEHYLSIGKFTKLKRFFELNHIDILPNIQLYDPNKTDTKECLKAPLFDNIEVSVIIPVYGKSNYTISCIKSIIESTKDIEYEIIVADDNPDSNEELNTKNIKYIKNRENLGFLKNCNSASKYAKGDYLVFLNNDVNVQDGWLNSLYNLIKTNSDIGLVGSKLLYPNLKLQEAGAIVWKDGSAWNYGKYKDPTNAEYNYIKECDYVSGACFIIRKSLWSDIGGFDERFAPAYYEDVDLAFEVRKRGYRVVYQPNSVVIHYEGVSHGNTIDKGIKKFQETNKEKFIKKWHKVLKKEHFLKGSNIFLARERSRDKKTILIIDHYIPHYDKDAGSKAIYMYIKYFIKSGYNVKFIGANFLHYPYRPYLKNLQQLGVEVLYGSEYQNSWREWIKRNKNHIDYIILCRPHIGIKYIDFLKIYTESKIYYMGIDLHYLRATREYFVTRDSESFKSINRWKLIELKLLKRCDLSLFFSDNETKEIKRRFDIDSIQIPLYLFEEFKKPKYNPQNRRDILFVGGFKHTPNIDAMVWFVKDIFPQIIEKIPDIKLYIIGSKPPPEITKLSNEHIVIKSDIDDNELQQIYNSIKISIAPLRYGAGIKGKVVEALYNGVPMVTTTIGAEGLNEADRYMAISDNASDFAKTVTELYLNTQKLIEMSHKGPLYCQKYFSYQNIQNIFKQIF